MEPGRIPRAALAALLLILTAPAQEPPLGPGQVRLLILHTNDLHGQIRPIPDPRVRNGPPRLAGGFQELVMAIDEERAAVSHSLLVDAGDWYQGTPEGTLSRGRCAIDLMNAAGYDFATVGNHDFDDGPANLLALVRRARFGVLGGNLRALGTETPAAALVQRFEQDARVDLEGFEVCLAGLLCEEAPRIVGRGGLDGLEVLSELESARRLRESARGAGAFVLVNHLGKDRNVILGRDVPGIDVIIGGHAHGDVLENGVRLESTGTLIAQAASSTQALGIVTLDVEPAAGKVIRKSARIRRIQPVEGARVPRIAPIAERYEAEVAERMDVPVAQVPELLPKEGSIEKPSPLGAWIAGVMKEATKADVAVHNTGGIRASLPAGRARVREFFQISPFGNRLTVLSLPGKDLRRLAEMTAANYGRGCVFAGVSIRWRRVDGESRRAQVVSLEREGKAVGDEEILRVVTTDFLASGADNMSPFRNATSREDLEQTLLDATLDAARKAGAVVAPAIPVWIPAP